MKKINTKFIAGMLAMALVFGMAGCDQGTNTVTEYVPIGGGGGTTENPADEVVRKERDLLLALTKDDVTVYVHSDITLSKPLTLRGGQNIVVGGDSGASTPVKSQGGLLFDAALPGSSSLNLAATLTLEADSSLRVAGGAAVNVITPTEGQAGTLYVKKDASVGVGVDVSGGTTLTTGASSLNVEASASLIFEKEATLAVTNNPAVSKVRLETETSAITLETGAKLTIAGTGTNANNVIGNNGNVVIEIPATAPAAIGTVTVTVEGTEAATIIAAVKEAVKGSPSKTTDKAVDEGSEPNKVLGVQSLLNDTSVTRVTYSGSTALADITIPENKTLVISGAVTGQAAEIGGTGTLEITGSVTTADSGVDAAALASLVKATGGGKVVLNSDVTITTELILEVNLTLEIAAGKTLALGTDGNIDLLDEDGNITGTIVNKGTISTAQDIDDGAGLGEFLALVGGTVEVSDADISVAAGTTLVIPTGTELKLSGNATLTNEATIAFDAGSTLTVDGSGTIDNSEDGATIETKSGTVLAVLLDNVDDGTIEVTANAALAASAEVAVGEDVTLEIANGVTLTVNGTLTVDGTIEGDGSITTAGSGKVEVAEGAEFTLSSGTITGDVTQVVDDDYTLPTDTESSLDDAAKNLSGITHTAKKSLATTGTGAGIVTIYLGGAVTADHALVTTWYGNAGSEKPDGNYAIATIDGLFTDITGALSAGRTIKQTNESLHWYKGMTHATNGYISDDVLTVATETTPHIYLGTNASDAFTWKKLAANTTDTESTVILWSGATEPKQAKLEIVPAGDGAAPAYTVIIDWTGLTINAPTE